MINSSSLKGALLEYIVRQILKNCGFTNVKADNLFVFQKGGLFFVNGKCAAHDADVLMEPPIQFPFLSKCTSIRVKHIMKILACLLSETPRSQMI